MRAEVPRPPQVVQGLFEKRFSPWGIGILKLEGNNFRAIVIRRNGTRFGGWLLNTADNRFWAAADFDGDGRDELFVSSPWGIGRARRQ